jgi:hypothetical protein
MEIGPLHLPMYADTQSGLDLNSKMSSHCGFKSVAAFGTDKRHCIGSDDDVCLYYYWVLLLIDIIHIVLLLFRLSLTF